jgi:dipeptidase E
MELVAPAASSGTAGAAGAAEAAKAAPGPKALVIANACDLLEPAERGFRVAREIAALEGLGFRAEELDLRRHFQAHTGKEGAGEGGIPGSPSALKSGLDSAALVWARGGNAFLLMRAMRQSGFADLLSDALAADTVAYGGYSGGIAVLPHTLRGLETVNDPAAIPEGYGYDAAVPWDGLGLLRHSLAPHYKSAHAASPGIDGVVRYFQAHRMPYQTLRDGEVLIHSGGREERVS